MSMLPVLDPLATLDALVREHRRALVAVARAEGTTPEEALESVQDALCTFLSRPPDASAGHEVATLRTMVKNAARNARRRHHRRGHDSVDASSELPGEAPDAESLLAHAEDVVRLRTCVAELCGVQRAVVTLRLLEERSGEDVAETLGVTRAHVDVLLYRARGALRVCMRHGRAVNTA